MRDEFFLAPHCESAQAATPSAFTRVSQSGISSRASRPPQAVKELFSGPFLDFAPRLRL